MSSTRFGFSAVLLVAIGVSAAPASAQQTFFGQDLRWALGAAPTVVGTNSAGARQSFLSNLVGVGTENFESFAVGSTAPLPLTFPGAGTATLNNGGSISSGAGSGRRATSGTRFWQVGTGSGGSQFSIAFGSSIAAFGVYGMDVGDFGDQLTLDFYNNNVLVDSWDPAHGIGGRAGGANDGNLNFFGYINTNNLFDEIRFSSTGNPSQDEDIWGFDDMTIGSRSQVAAVPEPASLLLLAAGFAGMVAARRRRITN